MIEWVWDERSDTWFTGTSNNGAGVYRSHLQTWEYSLVHPKIDLIIGSDPFASADEAMRDAAKELIELRKDD